MLAVSSVGTPDPNGISRNPNDAITGLISSQRAISPMASGAKASMRNVVIAPVCVWSLLYRNAPLRASRTFSVGVIPGRFFRGIGPGRREPEQVLQELA